MSPRIGSRPSQPRLMRGWEWNPPRPRLGASLSGPPASPVPRPRLRPRLGGRPRAVSHDLALRVAPSTADLLDRLGAEHGLDRSEVARVLLSAGLFSDLPLRDRAALALASNAGVHALAAATKIAEGIQPSLAAMCMTETGSALVIEPRAERGERGPGERSLLRVRLDERLHRRLRGLVDVFRAIRGGHDTVPDRDETEERFAQYLVSRPRAERRRERSPVAETARWVLRAAEADAEAVFDVYASARSVIWDHVDRAVAAMGAGVSQQLGAALAQDDAAARHGYPGGRGR